MHGCAPEPMKTTGIVQITQINPQCKSAQSLLFSGQGSRRSLTNFLALWGNIQSMGNDHEKIMMKR